MMVEGCIELKCTGKFNEFIGNTILNPLPRELMTFIDMIIIHFKVRIASDFDTTILQPLLKE
jgi:hypothetical protein